ncbi:hypothetical protein AB0F91_47020 [Amycolatopsis sp. NPDC023774]
MVMLNIRSPIGFVVVDLADFERRRVVPKQHSAVPSGDGTASPSPG